MIRLTILTGVRKGQQLELAQAVIRLGRAEDCDVRLDGAHDLTVSGHHAEILVEDGVHLLIDTGSTNGTRLNGRPVVKQQLHPGDQLRLGGEHGVELRVDARVA
jgi:pSer/pThr/pTyr-binding forkhead associated (FHA) protein